MAVTISLFLFGKPAHELDREGEVIGAGDVRALAESMHQRLLATADALEKLEAGGWEGQMALYDVILSHPYVDTEAQARDWLTDHGLDPEEFLITELEDEDDFEEEPEEGSGEIPGPDEP